MLPVTLQPHGGQNHQAAAKAAKALRAIEPKPLLGKLAAKQAHMPTWLSSSGTASVSQVGSHGPSPDW